MINSKVSVVRGDRLTKSTIIISTADQCQAEDLLQLTQLESICSEHHIARYLWRAVMENVTVRLHYAANKNLANSQPRFPWKPDPLTQHRTIPALQRIATNPKWRFLCDQFVHKTPEPCGEVMWWSRRQSQQGIIQLWSINHRTIIYLHINSWSQILLNCVNRKNPACRNTGAMLRYFLLRENKGYVEKTTIMGQE